jgi:hypothetical protein
MVTIGGFDTHNVQNQASGDIDGRHTELLTELSAAVDAFMADINADSIGDDVVGLTFSEFGRKAKQNGNLGTDHGEIAPMFVFGKPVQGGVSGVNVDLTEATSNNNWQIKTVQHDYRQVFATLMQDFLGAENAVVDNAFFDQTNNESFSSKKIQEIIKPSHYVDSTCYTLSNNLPKNETFWAAYPNPVYDKLFVNPINDNSQGNYAIHHTNGRLIKSGKLDLQLGYAAIDMASLPHGLYVVTLQANGMQETKKIIKA